MISSPPARMALPAVVIAISGTSAAAWPHEQGQMAHVRFLATGTLVRFIGA
jgi:hypothetical protein